MGQLFVLLLPFYFHLQKQLYYYFHFQFLHRIISEGLSLSVPSKQAFLQVLRDQGVSVVGERTFGDHFAYTAEDVQSLARQAESASVVITTEKDAVKAAPLWPVGGKPLYALRIRMKMDDEAGFFQAIDNIMSIADGRYAF
jgi:hypothetical protein